MMSSAERQALVISLVAVLVGAALAVAGSQESIRVLGNLPLFALGILIAFVVQWICFVPAWLWKSEHSYDLIGSLTYSSIVLITFALAQKWDVRSIVLTVLIVTWASRLGFFLFRRVRKAGEDQRFADIKVSFWKFWMAWTLQGLWVSCTLAAALAAMTGQNEGSFGVWGIWGVGIWMVGFAFEAIADWQKSRFKANRENQGRFISTGLWSRSRHPNYFGEIVLWVGIALIALPALQGWSYVTLISPVFVYLLLTRGSGVPILEKRADAKWGGEQAYEAYKRNTPELFPRIF